VDATDDQIKTAYRDLAMVWHPDRFGDSDTRRKKKAEEQFKAISAAYTYLQEHNLRPAVGNGIEKAAPQKNGQWVFIEEETIQSMRETTEDAKQINKDTREFLDRMKQQRH
jgi:curved DNA-binding protein CbpA